MFTSTRILVVLILLLVLLLLFPLIQFSIHAFADDSVLTPLVVLFVVIDVNLVVMIAVVATDLAGARDYSFGGEITILILFSYFSSSISLWWGVFWTRYGNHTLPFQLSTEG